MYQNIIWALYINVAGVENSIQNTSPIPIQL